MHTAWEIRTITKVLDKNFPVYYFLKNSLNNKLEIEEKSREIQ